MRNGRWLDWDRLQIHPAVRGYLHKRDRGGTSCVPQIAQVPESSGGDSSSSSSSNTNTNTNNTNTNTNINTTNGNHNSNNNNKISSGGGSNGNGQSNDNHSSKHGHYCTSSKIMLSGTK